MQDEQQQGDGAGWSFKNEDTEQLPAASAPQSAAPQSITWTGSEFIAQHKDVSWYAGLAGALLVCCVATFFITKHDVLSVLFIIIMGILFGVIASRKPRQLTYLIDDKGITIGAKHYPYAMFKSFALQYDGAIGYISLLSLHRFQPEISIYFAPEDEERIFDTLGSYLPHEQRTERVVDRITKRIRF